LSESVGKDASDQRNDKITRGNTMKTPKPATQKDDALAAKYRPLANPAIVAATLMATKPKVAKVQINSVLAVAKA